jgi:hypothetical protein
MTKTVRIENADSGTFYKVVVEIWDRGYNGLPDTLAKTVNLDYPTAMTGSDVYITDSRYLVVREAK